MASRDDHHLLRMAPASPTRTRAEQIADAIARDIAEGRLQPNQKLSESKLATHFQVSRGPIRDALDLLERNMLVTIKPRSYTQVNQLTIRELEQVFDFRKQVLGLAAKFAARNRTADDLHNIAVELERMVLTLKEDKSQGLTQAFPFSELWDLVIDASHSPVVRQACLHFTGGNIWSKAVADKISDAEIPAFQEKRLTLWEVNFNAIKRNDEHAASEAGEALVENNWNFLKGTFRHYFPEK